MPIFSPNPAIMVNWSQVTEQYPNTRDIISSVIICLQTDTVFLNDGFCVLSFHLSLKVLRKTLVGTPAYNHGLMLKLNFGPKWDHFSMKYFEQKRK